MLNDYFVNVIISMNNNNNKTLFDIDSGMYDEGIIQIQDGLMSFGLTSNQSKVFICLGKYGPSTAPNVCRILKQQRTETYSILSVLQSKGIVLATFHHPTVFNAVSMDKTIETLINSKKEILKSVENTKCELVRIWNTIPSFDLA